MVIKNVAEKIEQKSCKVCKHVYSNINRGMCHKCLNADKGSTFFKISKPVMKQWVKELEQARVESKSW